MTQTDPFHFYTERRLVRLTGRRARTLAELIGHVEGVSGSSIFYHTHHLYLSHHFGSRCSSTISQTGPWTRCRSGSGREARG